LVKPSKQSIVRFKKKISSFLQKSTQKTSLQVVLMLNPILRGWGNYYQHVVSKDVFNALGHYIWTRVWAWICKKHPKQPRKALVKRFFTVVDKRNWVFYGLSGDVK